LVVEHKYRHYPGKPQPVAEHIVIAKLTTRAPGDTAVKEDWERFMCKWWDGVATEGFEVYPNKPVGWND
jgi:hypothetical protein